MLGIGIAYYSTVNFSFYPNNHNIHIKTHFLHLLSATWQYYSLVDLAEEAGVLWQQEYPCGQSVGSEAKPVRNNVPGNGSLILFHPRGKAFMFQLDTHGWTEVKGMADLMCVCLAGGGSELWTCVCVWMWVCACVFVWVKLTLLSYYCYCHTQALHDVVRWGHSWQQRNPNDPQCSSLNQEVPIKPGGTTESRKHHPSLSPSMTSRSAVWVTWCICYNGHRHWLYGTHMHSTHPFLIWFDWF